MERCSMSTSSRTWTGTPSTSSLPRNRFATTSRLSQSARSWKTVAIPRLSAACGVLIRTCFPSKYASPVSGGWTPSIALISVLLPAPLSPTRATISPLSTSKSTLCRARTGPKLFENPRSARRCSVEPRPLLLPVDSASPRATWGFISLIHHFLTDSSLLAGGLELGRAHLIRLPVAVGPDQLLTAELGSREAGGARAAIQRHRHRREQGGRDIGRTVVGLRGDQSGRDGIALGQGHGDLRRGLGLRRGRLVA